MLFIYVDIFNVIDSYNPHLFTTHFIHLLLFDYSFLTIITIIDTFLFTANSIAHASIVIPFHYGYFNTFTVPSCVWLIIWLCILTTILYVVVVIVAITYSITIIIYSPLASTTPSTVQTNTV